MNVKKLFRIISLGLACVTSAASIGCNAGNAGKEESSSSTVAPESSVQQSTTQDSSSTVESVGLPEIDQAKWLYGGCELASEVGPTGDWRDPGNTMEWTAKTAGALGVKSHRVWMHLDHIIGRKVKSNDLYFLEDAVENYHRYFQLLKENGVERIVVMNHRFLYPYGFKPGTTYSVPDPVEDYDIYKEWLEMYTECYKMLATEFTEIDFWECGNEFDLTQFLHKSNYKTDPQNGILTEGEAAAVTADLCYAARKGVKSVDDNNYVVLPGISEFATNNYFESIYLAIESKEYPTIEEYYVTDPDEYFDILAWHAYPINSTNPATNSSNVKGDVDKALTTFKNRCLELHETAKKHGDGEKRVWFTEIGGSELYLGKLGSKAAQEMHAQYLLDIFNIVTNDLPFVETCFWFRYSSLAVRNVEPPSENHFGIFYSPDDTVNKGKPKPVALAYFRLINGENADTSPLYWYSKK